MPAIAHASMPVSGLHVEMYGADGSLGGAMSMRATASHIIVTSEQLVARAPPGSKQAWVSPCVMRNRSWNGGSPLHAASTRTTRSPRRITRP